MVVDEVIVHRNDNVDITLAIPIESEPTTEDSVSVQTLANLTTLEPRFSILSSWVGRRPQGGGWPWGAEWSHPAWAAQAAIYTYGSFGKSRDAGRRDA